MEERWLSRKRRHPAPDIREFIRVHGKVVKPRLVTNEAKTPTSQPKLSMWQTNITNCHNAREQFTAFAYTTGVRKKAARDQVHDVNKNVVPDRTVCVSTREGGTTAEDVTNDNVTIVERSPTGDQVVTCSKQDTAATDALSDYCSFENEDHRQSHTSLKIMDRSDLYSYTNSTFWSEDLGSIDPNLIDTEELLRELSD